MGVVITVIIDETGDRKKGKKTDYVARQDLGSIGKIDNGIVSVNAYGVYQNITFPLIFKVFKPKGTLKQEVVKISFAWLTKNTILRTKKGSFLPPSKPNVPTYCLISF